MWGRHSQQSAQRDDTPGWEQLRYLIALSEVIETALRSPELNTSKLSNAGEPLRGALPVFIAEGNTALATLTTSDVLNETLIQPLLARCTRGSKPPPAEQEVLTFLLLELKTNLERLHNNVHTRQTSTREQCVLTPTEDPFRAIETCINGLTSKVTRLKSNGVLVHDMAQIFLNHVAETAWARAITPLEQAIEGADFLLNSMGVPSPRHSLPQYMPRGFSGQIISHSRRNGKRV